MVLDKATGKMSIKSGDRVVVSESASLDLDKKGTVQTLAKEKSENFFGGGTQNGRFLHTNQTIAISNTNNWTDGRRRLAQPVLLDERRLRRASQHVC